MSIRKTILASVVGSFAMIGANATEAETIPERLMGDLQEDFGLADFQAAGVVGNLARETGNFRYLQEIDPLVEGSAGGIGYAQWTGPRRRAYEAWADGRDLTSYEVNYGFLVVELTGPYARVVEKLRKTRTAEEAAKVFMKRFLMPHPNYQHLDERISYANAYLAGDFTGAGCQETHEVEASGRLLIVSLCPDKELPQDISLGLTLALADIEELTASEDQYDVEIVMASAAMPGIPLRSDRPMTFPEEYNVESPFRPVALGVDDEPQVEQVHSTERSARDVVYGLLEID